MQRGRLSAPRTSAAAGVAGRDPAEGAPGPRASLLLGALAALRRRLLLLVADLVTCRRRSRSFRSDLAFLPVGLAVVALAVRAARAAGLDPGTRRAWRLLATALLLLLARRRALVRRARGSGRIRSNTTTGPAYVVGQAAYVAYYPPLLLGLLSFPRFLRTRTETLQFWLDVLTVFLGGLMLLWSVLIAPIAERRDRATSPTLLPWPIGYPLGDLVLLFGMAVVAVRRRDGAGRASSCSR